MFTSKQYADALGWHPNLVRDAVDCEELYAVRNPHKRRGKLRFTPGAIVDHLDFLISSGSLSEANKQEVLQRLGLGFKLTA